jgi:hypothetical protein
MTKHVKTPKIAAKVEAPLLLKKSVTITAPRFDMAHYRIIGTTPYMQARFTQKAKNQMRAKMEAGSQARKGQKREPRDFKADYEAAKYVSAQGWNGIPAGAFRAAAISACKIVGFHMSKAKLALFFEHDGFDKYEGTPLIRIEGTPEMNEMAVRNDNGGADLRVRPMWREWSCNLRVSYDTDMFSEQDVTNLLVRAGMQIGIGEGRPDSRKGFGLGLGLFKLAGDE